MYDARHAVGVAVIACLNDCNIALAYPTQTALTAEQAGMTLAPASARGADAAVAKPPSSGDRSAADQ